jgi:hypothetical protein
VIALESTRREWEQSHERLEAAAGDRARYERLLELVDVVTSELRRRVGQTYTLSELARAYGEADHWALHAVSDAAPPRGWPRELAIVTGAAFHAYARGATDYRP